MKKWWAWGNKVILSKVTLFIRFFNAHSMRKDTITHFFLENRFAGIFLYSFA
jgi:hypothetical protein